MSKHIRIAIIAIILLLIAGIYVLKNKDDISLLSSSVAENAGELQSGRAELEIDFTPALIQENEKPLILVMGTSSCGPCLRMIPGLRELAGRADADVRYIDINENSEVMSYIPVRVTPTTALYLPGGKPFEPAEDSAFPFTLYSSRNTGEHMVTVIEGYLSKEQIESLIEEMV